MSSSIGVQAPGSTVGRAEQRLLEIAMVAAGLAAFGLLYCTQALLPAIGSSFGVGPVAASLTVSCATGALALGILPMTALAESYGRARVMRIGLVTALALVVGCAATTSFWQLLVGRALMGLALAAVVAVAMGHLGDEISPPALAAAMGLYVAGNTLGGVAGRLVPGVVQVVGSWRVGLLALGGFAAVAVIAFVVLLPAPRQFRPAPARMGTHVAAMREVLRDGGTRRLCAIAFLLMGGFVACYNYLTFRLVSRPIHLSASVAALLFLAYFAGTLSSASAGRMVARFGRRTTLGAGIVICIAGLLLTLPNSLWCIATGLLVFTAGFFTAHSVASGWVSARSPGHRGQACALYLLAYYLGSSTLGAGLGIVYSAAGWGATVVSISTCASIAVWFALGVRESPPIDEEY